MHGKCVEPFALLFGGEHGTYRILADLKLGPTNPVRLAALQDFKSKNQWQEAPEWAAKAPATQVSGPSGGDKLCKLVDPTGVSIKTCRVEVLNANTSVATNTDLFRVRLSEEPNARAF